MLEIPEAVSISAQLARTFSGKVIRTVEVGHTTHKFAWFYGKPDDYQKISVGKTVDGARAVGGMVEASAGNLRLLFSEGVNLRLCEPGAEPPKKRQLLITFSDDSALCVSVQMYGGMGIFAEGQCDNQYYLVANERPSPLSDEFNWDHFKTILEAPGAEKLSAKALLATEQRVPGLGNGVLQDILFQARLNPKTKVVTLDDPALRHLYDSTRSTLKEMVELGGRDTELDLVGKPGGYRTLMSRNTVGTPCPVCGEEIRKASYMGGSVYFCPVCQP